MRNMNVILSSYAKTGVLTIGFLLLSFCSALAGIDPSVERIETQVGGPSLSLIDGINTSIVSSAASSLPSNSIHNRISMFTNINYQMLFDTAMEIEVTMDVAKYYNATDLTPASVEPLTLTITYDPFSGEQYMHSQGVRDFGYRKMEVSLTEIKVDGTSQDILPELVVIELQILYLKLEDFSINDSPTLQYSVLNLGCEQAPTSLNVNWTNVQGAIEYQLEWLHINDYGPIDYSDPSNPQSTVINPNNLNYNFKFNSTRITTTFNDYDVSLIFDRGHVLFRVRAVGIDAGGNYLFGPWSPAQSQSSNSNGIVGNYLSTCRYHITESASHEQMLNWQYAATYAEEGKRKEVISYFDGSLRNRQTVTKINSDENRHVVVGETIYDHQGRPAITVLPAPVPNCEDGSEQVIQFFPNFNQNENGQPYSKLDFDTDILDADGAPSCAIEAPGMLTESGAAHYYSSMNSTLSDPSLSHQAYVPSAQINLEDVVAFPFVQVEYTPDNTGRIRRQGGVGPDYQMGSDHETRYIYGYPNQVELDRLFGSEVGYAQHYKKNIVVDAHRQVSVSYLDQEGRVIATALAGPAPENLQAIASEADAFQTLTINALDNEAVYQTYPAEEKIIFSQELPVSYDSEYNFAYTLSIDPLTLDCMPDICFDCVYNLKFELLDECGVDQFAGIPEMIGRFSQENGVYQFHTDCQNTNYELNLGAIEGVNINVLLTVGAYSFNKILTINQDAKQAFIQAYMNSDCVVPFQEFLDEALSDVDFSDCDIDCESCLENLGSIDDYLAQGGSIFDYNEEADLCAELCNEGEPYSYCENSFNIMVMDMMPQGQYGKVYDNNYQVVSNASNISIYNPNNILPGFDNQNTSWKNPIYYHRETGTYKNAYFESNGDSARVSVAWVNGVLEPSIDNPNVNVHSNNDGTFYAYPQHLTNLADFVLLCNTNWAKSLVHHHPEFCSYITCVGVEDYKDNDDFYTSNTFDDLLIKSEDFIDAQNNGIISTNVLNNDGWFDIQSFNWFGANNLENLPADPYAVYYADINTNIGSGLCDLGNLQNKFYNYAEINGQMYSMPEIAAYTVRCASEFWDVPSTACFNFGGQIPINYQGTLEELRNQEWEVLKSYYISEKQQMLTKFLDCASAKVCDAYTGCIGKQDYNPFVHFIINNGTSFFNSDYFSLNQPCGAFTFQSYQNLVRRFGFAEDALPIQTPNDIAYNIYLQTGQCPVPFALQNYLTELAEEELLDQPITNLHQIPNFVSIWIMNNNFQTPGTIPLYNQSISVNGNSLVMNWLDPNNNTTFATITLNQTANFVNWSNITQFLNLSATNANDFTVQGFTENNEAVEIVGSISAPFNLYPCSFEPSGTQNNIGAEIQFLINSMATSNNLTSTTGVAVTPLVVSGQNFDVVGSGLQTLIGSNTLNWIQSSSTSFNLYDFTNSSCKQLTINFTNPTINLANVEVFTNLVSAGQHTFTVTAHVGAQTYSLTGSVVLNNCGTEQGIAVGNFDLPVPVTCQSDEHKAFDILVDVLEYMLINDDLTQSINIFNNPLMAEPLISQMYEGYYSTSSFVSNSIFALEIKNQNDVTCFIELELLANAISFNDISSVESAFTIGQVNYFNNYNELILNVTFDNASITEGQIKITAPCLNLLSCNPCPDGYELQTFDAQQDSIIVQQKALQGDIIIDESIQKYEEYSVKVDDFNNANNYIETDANFILKLTYDEFITKGFDLPGSDYTRYLQEMTEAVDDDTYLRSPEKFALDHGAGTNVLFEHQRYLKAIDNYNARAAIQGAPSLSPISKELFAHARLARNNQLYIAYLQLKPQGQMGAENILSFLDVDSNNLLSSNDFQLYANYVDAYFDFIADSANFHKLCDRTDILPTLAAFEDLEENFIFCSPDAKNLLNAYITDLQNRCVGEFPALRACDITKRKDELEEQRFYIYYLELLNQYNQTLWAAENNYNLVSNYTNNDHFWKYYQREMILAYADYLSAYKNLNTVSASEQEHLPLKINTFEQYYHALKSGAQNDCIEDYENYLHCWNELEIYYQQNLVHLPDFKRFNFLILTHQQFLEMQLCDSVGAFCAQAQNIISNNTVPTPEGLINLLKFDNLCPVIIEYKPSYGWIKPDEPCREAYHYYLNCLNNFRIYYQENLASLPEFANWSIYRYNYEQFLSLNYCHCVDEFCAQLQAIMDGVTPASYYHVSRAVSMRFACKEPCTPDVAAQFPIQAFEVDTSGVDDCYEMLYNQAYFVAMNNYEMYLDSVVGAISQLYTYHCYGLSETLTYTYDDKQYHYTLYYYDQAGNLIKTIPPAGVQQLDITSSDDPLALACKSDRNNHTKTVFTNHRLPTRYEYNSLNQLVAQSTPDTDPMNIFEPTLPNGLHPQLITNKIQMVNEAVGYLVGEVDDVAYMYKTTNQGFTWQRIHGLAGADFRDVLMVTATEGYAVAAPGLLFKTTDAGINWMLQNFWVAQNSGQVRSLNALAYHNNTLLIGGNDGLLVTLNNGNYNVISNMNPNFDITAAIHNDVLFYLTANHQDGFSQVFTLDANNQLSELQDFIPTRMNCLDIHDNKGYLAGDDGRIFVKQDIWNASIESWQAIDVTINLNIQKLVVFEPQQMLALANNRIWRTMNGGSSWTQTSNFEFLDIHKSENGNSAIAIGQNGSVEIIAMFSPNAPGNNDTPENQHIPLGFAAQPITNVWHQVIENNNQSKTLVVYSRGNELFFSKNAMVSNPLWQNIPLPAGAVDIADMKLSYIGSFANPQIKGLLMLNDGSLLSLSTDPSIQVLNGIDGTNYVAISKLSQNVFSAISQNGGARAITINNDATFSQTPEPIVNDLVEPLTLGDKLYTSNNNNIVISTVNYRFNFATTINLQNITNKTKPSKLWDLNTQNNTLIAVGNQGAVYRLVNTNWIQQATQTSRHIYAAHNHNDFFYLAGENGYFSRGDFNNDEFQGNPLNATIDGTVANAVSEDLFGIVSNGNAMYAFGQNGRVVYAPNANTQAFAKLTFGSQNLYAGAAQTTGGGVMILGNASSMYKANGAVPIKENRIHVPPLQDVHFAAINIG